MLNKVIDWKAVKNKLIISETVMFWVLPVRDWTLQYHPHRFWRERWSVVCGESCVCSSWIHSWCLRSRVCIFCVGTITKYIFLPLSMNHYYNRTTYTADLIPRTRSKVITLKNNITVFKIIKARNMWVDSLMCWKWIERYQYHLFPYALKCVWYLSGEHL
jgi:hypothetical protein